MSFFDGAISTVSTEYKQLKDNAQVLGRKAQIIAVITAVAAVALLALGITAAIVGGPVGIGVGAALIFVGLPLFYTAYNGYHIAKNVELVVAKDLTPYADVSWGGKLSFTNENKNNLTNDLSPGTCIPRCFIATWVDTLVDQIERANQRESNSPLISTAREQRQAEEQRARAQEERRAEQQAKTQATLARSRAVHDAIREKRNLPRRQPAQPAQPSTWDNFWKGIFGSSS